MAELADALGSGPSARKGIGVQIPFLALTQIAARPVERSEAGDI